MRANHSPARRLGALVLLAAAAACSDRNPVAGGPPAGPAPQTAKLECVVQVRAATMTCAPVGPDGTGPRASVILGGQDTYVRLESSNVSYDSATLRADVTLQNLMPQPMGTSDGFTPAPEGNLVFFASGPVVTSGTGTVTVANPDTMGTFTATNQPAFRYPGIIQPYQISAPKQWRFSAPATVQTFEFTVFVQTRLPNETGWVDVAPPRPTVLAGGTVALRGTVRTLAGAVSGIQSKQWFSSDTTIAKVDSLGVVTGIRAGTVTISALSGKSFGSQTLTVYSAGRIGGDVLPPTVDSFAIAPRRVETIYEPMPVDLALRLTDVGTGVYPLSLLVTFQGESQGPVLSTSNCFRASGTNNDGMWSCTLTVPQYAEVGAYTVQRIHVEDQAGNVTEVNADDLRKAGFPVTLYVVAAERETTPPSLLSFGFTPQGVDVRTGPATVLFELTAADSVSGVGSALIVLTSPSGSATRTSEPCMRVGGDALLGNWQCQITVPPYVEDGTWSVAVSLTDRVGNEHSYSGAELSRRDFPSTLEVTSTSDTVPPSLAAFTWAPDSVTVNDSTGATVNATVRALDAISGVGEVSVTFTAPSGFEASGGCTMVSGTGVDGTWTCAVELDPDVEGGTWTASVLIRDRAGNERVYTTGELQELGYKVNLKVVNTSTPPVT